MRRRLQEGFSLLELLIVVAILGILAAIAVPSFLSARMAANESAAIATLRSFSTAQAQVQGTVRIDADADSIGEFGTFVELVGGTGVRTRAPGAEPAGSDFSTQGTVMDPSPLPSSMMDYMDESGYLLKGGYAFAIFLPDTAEPAGWTREELKMTASAPGTRSRTVESVGLRGGTGLIGIDLAESVWCVYAQPSKFGTTGSRAFFTNQGGDVLQCDNTTAKHQGTTTALQGNSAFLGAGITSELAVGTMGNDGEVWKITN
jgi:type IV pilus assembly protein PilA